MGKQPANLKRKTYKIFRQSIAVLSIFLLIFSTPVPAFGKPIKHDASLRIVTNNILHEAQDHIKSKKLRKDKAGDKLKKLLKK